MDFQEALFGPLGLLAGSLIAIGAFVTGRIVTRAHLQDVLRLMERRMGDVESDRDFWRTAALAGTSLAQKATDLAKKKTENVEA